MKINPIEIVSVSQIQGNKSNPRYIKDKEFKELVASINNFPKMMEARPIIVDENGVILGGNMRYRAALELGYTEVHIIRITDATEEQKREFIIKDNVSKGEWDWDMLANEWDSNDLSEWGLVLPYAGGETDLSEFFDGEVEKKSNQFKIVLDYTEEDYNTLIEALNLIGGSKEKIIFDLIVNEKAGTN